MKFALYSFLAACLFGIDDVVSNMECMECDIIEAGNQAVRQSGSQAVSTCDLETKLNSHLFDLEWTSIPTLTSCNKRNEKSQEPMPRFDR
jgi:hypothetical protein